MNEHAETVTHEAAHGRSQGSLLEVLWVSTRLGLTCFGGPIAHGFLTLSLLTPLTGAVMQAHLEGAVMAINYGLDRVRFITPVRVGSRIRGRVKLVEVKPIENGVQLKTESTIEIEGSDRPAAVVESLVRLYG